MLDWSSGSGGDVCAALKTQFEMAKTGVHSLQFNPGRTLKKVERVDDDWRLTFQHGAVEEPRLFRHVLFAIGFGEEKPCGASAPVDYWKPTNVGTAAAEPVADATYLVSGNGDGALTELLSLCLVDFEHVTFTKAFLGMLPAHRARAAVEVIYSGQAHEADLEPALAAHLRPVLEEHGVLDQLRPILRTDRRISANSNGPLLAAGKAAQLNQCMVYAVLEAAKLENRPIRRTHGKVTNTVKDTQGIGVDGIADADGPVTDLFKHVILRHGPDKAARYATVPDQLAAHKAALDTLIATNAALDAPPVLSDALYDFFEQLRIDKLADHASKQAQTQTALQEHSLILIARDPVAGAIVERGARRLSEIANLCERLPAPFRVQLGVRPTELKRAADLVRIARASGGRVEMRAEQAVLTEWQALMPYMPGGSASLARYRPTVLDDAPLAGEVDCCLLRLLDRHVTKAVADGGCVPLGTIDAPILAAIATTWGAWQASLLADADLRFDFLRWLANVVQDPARPWDGDIGNLERLGNAIVMMLAAHCGELLAPAREDRGNLRFSADAVALGSGCAAIGFDSISIWTRPEDWGVDALILSAASDIEIQDAGGVLDAGVAGTSMKRARRVAPAVIQNSVYWRTKLGSIADWKAAVEAEFKAFRDRQDKAIEEVSG